MKRAAAPSTGASRGDNQPATYGFLRRWIWLPILILLVLATVAGLRRGQWTDVQSWFNSVCSACIGLTFR